jgi:3-oxoacyl-[acyl-carrier-protein] synthase II
MNTLPVTGWSLHVPDADVADAATRAGARAPEPWAVPVREASCPPDQASTLLGRRGLLYKEPATRLALCAVHRALGLPAGHRPGGPVDPGTAVVACANLGNVETVATVARTVATEGGRAVSPLAAPNASSNVVASTVALWFRFGGPNLMVCSGATAGLDALWLAGLLLRAGRAERVVVVGAEPADEVATTLHATALHATALHATALHATASHGSAASHAPLRAGAACVVLGPAGAPAPVSVSMMDGLAADAGTVLGPGGVDLAALWGDCYGAQGLVAVALAAHLTTAEPAGDGPDPIAVRCGDGTDGWRSARVSAAERRGVWTEATRRRSRCAGPKEDAAWGARRSERRTL